MRQSLRIFYHLPDGKFQANFTLLLDGRRCYKKSQIAQTRVLYHLHNLALSSLSHKSLSYKILRVYTIPLMLDQPPLADSSHPELRFIFRARMKATNPAKPSTPITLEVEEVMEIGSEDEVVPSTPVTRKGKEQAQGSGKPPKSTKLASGKPRTSLRHAKSPRSMLQAHAVQEEAFPANPINWLPPFIHPRKPLTRTPKNLDGLITYL